jgi:hypothetical protein
VKRNPGQASPSIPDFALLNPGYARCNTQKITDTERTELAVRGGEGKRLIYHQSN